MVDYSWGLLRCKFALKIGQNDLLFTMSATLLEDRTTLNVWSASKKARQNAVLLTERTDETVCLGPKP